MRPLRLAGFLSIPLIIVVAFGLARWLWVVQLESESESRTRELGEELAGDLVAGRTVSDSAYKQFVQSQAHRVGYVAIANFKNGFRSGVINASLLEEANHGILDYRKEHGDTATLARLIQPGAGFPGEYLDVLSMSFVPNSPSTDRAPIAVLKVGYVFPGFPLGRGYVQLWWGIFLFTSVVSVGAWSFAMAMRKPPPVIRVAERPPKGDMEELEDELTADDKIEVDDQGRAWRVLFNGENLSGWLRKGSWYVIDECVFGQPWGSSLIHKRVATDGNYSFQVSGRKMAGPDGLIVLFPVNGHTLAWVVGGWGNAHSEVGGYPSTRSNDAVELHRWYDMEVRIQDETAEGYINGRRAWQVPRAEITVSSTDTGFQEGLGVAVWNTLAKFRDFRFHTV